MNTTKKRNLMAKRFLDDLSLKEDFESLIQMVQLPYLQDISKEIAEDESFGNFSDGRGFQSLFGNNRSYECQKAFLKKLIEVTEGDKNILLAFVSLRKWWRSRNNWSFAWCEYSEEEDRSIYGYRPYYLCLNIIKYLTPGHINAVDMTLPPEYDCRYDPYHPRAYITHISELRKKYEFNMSFEPKLLSPLQGQLVARLKTFGALRQLYGSGQHTNHIGVVLLTHACDFATTTEELTLVTRWLLNAKRSETVHLKKRLKPLLKKLIATL